MIKKSILILGVFFLIISISTTAKAVQNVTTEEEINTAIQNNENEIVLENDIYLENTVIIPEGKSITLDLNGKQITVKKNGLRSLYAIDNNGSFILKDSIGGGAITARGIENLETGNMQIDSGIIIACDTNGGAAIWNDGDLTINGGSFKTTYEGLPSDTYGPGCLNNGGKAIINGGIFSSVSRRTYAVISTGNIELNNEPQVIGAHGGLAIDAGTATVNGGNFESTEYYGLYVSNDGTGMDPEQAQVTVNNGVFTGKTYSVWIGSDVNNPVNSTIQINGGTFNKSLSVQSNVEENAGIKVYGGKFISDVTQYTMPGYICQMQDDYYYVLKEYKINIEDTENGAVSTNLQKAIKGTTVKLTINANQGYEIDQITVSGKDGSINVNNNEFIMPNSDVTINVSFKKLTQEVKVIGENIIFAQDEEKVKEVLNKTLEQDSNLSELAKTTNLDIIVQAGEMQVSTDIKKKFEEMLLNKSENIKIAKFIDISILVINKNTNTEVGKLTNLVEPITITLTIPEELKNAEEGYTRNYYIAREHNNEIEILETKKSEDGKTLQITTDKFSPYVIAYEDVKEETPVVNGGGIKELIKNPRTGDIIIAAVVVFGTSVAGLIGTQKIKNK